MMVFTTVKSKQFSSHQDSRVVIYFAFDCGQLHKNRMMVFTTVKSKQFSSHQDSRAVIYNGRLATGLAD